MVDVLEKNKEPSTDYAEHNQMKHSEQISETESVN